MTGHMRYKRDTQKKRFLAALTEQGTVYHAAHAAGVSRQTVYRWRDEDLVFASSDGTPLQRRNESRRYFKPALHAAGLSEDLSLYALRHSCATLLLQANVHPKIVAERLGHSSVTLTMDVYSHVLPTMQTEATAQLERMLYG